MTVMGRTEELLAASLTASDTRLIPFLPYLLQDIYELGSDPRVIETLLRQHAPPDGSARIIDLGCGKGAVSHQLARSFGCHVEGRDLMEAFIVEARERAGDLGISHLCRFAVEDATASVTHERGYDVVVFGAVGDIFGDHGRMLSGLANVARTGGFIVIDDACGEDPGEYLTLAMWHRLFREARCEVVAQVPTDACELARVNELNQRKIELRAAQLSSAHPDMASMFTAYVADQQAECDALASTLIGVTWLLRTR